MQLQLLKYNAWYTGALNNKVSLESLSLGPERESCIQVNQLSRGEISKYRLKSAAI